MLPHFITDIHYACNGKVFATKTDAEIYKEFLYTATRKVYGIFITKEPVTYRFLLEEVA